MIIPELETFLIITQCTFKVRGLFLFWLQFSHIPGNPGSLQGSCSTLCLACSTLCCHGILLLFTVYSFSCCDQIHLNMTQWFGLVWIWHRAVLNVQTWSVAQEIISILTVNPLWKLFFGFQRDYELGAYFTPRRCP